MLIFLLLNGVLFIKIHHFLCKYLPFLLKQLYLNFYHSLTTSHWSSILNGTGAESVASFLMQWFTMKKLFSFYLAALKMTCRDFKLCYRLKKLFIK